MELIQAIMPDYQIQVFNSMTPGSLVYIGPEAENVIDLYNHDKHMTSNSDFKLKLIIIMSSLS